MASPDHIDLDKLVENFKERMKATEAAKRAAGSTLVGSPERTAFHQAEEDEYEAGMRVARCVLARLARDRDSAEGVRREPSSPDKPKA
jgi:hypothetical protein